MENNLNEVSNFDQLMQKYLKDQKQILTEIDYKTPLKEISPIEPLIFKNEPMSMNNNNSKKINNIEPIYDNENIESYNYKLNQNYHNMNNYPYINNDNDMNENKFITPIKPINQKISKSYINSSIEREKLAKEEKKKKQLEYQKMLDEQIKEKKERQRKEREKRLLEEKNFEEKFKLENEIYEQPIKISNKKYRNISNIFSEEIEPNNNNNNININNLNNNNNINRNNINYNNNINEEQEYEQNYQNELNNNNRMIRRTKSQPHFEVMNNKLFQPINNPNFQNPPPYPDIDSQQNSNSNPNLIQPQIPIEHLVSTSTQIPNQFLTPANQNNYLFPAYKTQNNYYPSSRQNKNINLNYNQNIQNPSQDINQYLTQRQYNEYHPPKLQQPISSDLGSNTNISISPSNFPTCYQMPFNNNLMNSSPNVNFNNNSQNVNELFNMNMNNMNNINNQNYFKIIEMFFHEQEKIMESYKETIEKLKNERDEALYRNRANEQKILALEKMQKDKELLEKNLGYFPFKNGYQQNLEKTLDSIMQKNEDYDYNNINNMNNINNNKNIRDMSNISNISDSKLNSLIASTKLVKVNNGDNKELLETWKKEEKIEINKDNNNNKNKNNNNNNKIIKEVNYENNQKKKLRFNGMDTNSFMEKINAINNKILEPPEEPQKYLNVNNLSLISKTQKNDEKSFANEISNINSNKETSNNNNSNNITTDIKITNNNNDNIDNMNIKDEISYYTKKDKDDDIRNTDNDIIKDNSDINKNDIMLNNVHNIVMENLDNNISYSTQLKEKLEKERKLKEQNKLNINNNNISEKEDKISKYTDIEKTKYQNYTFKQLNFSNSKQNELKIEFNDNTKVKLNPNLKNIDNNLTVSSKKNDKEKNPFDNIISKDDEEENIINTDINNNTNKNKKDKDKSEYIDEDINDMPNLDSPRNNDSQNFDIQRNTNIDNKNEESYYSTNRKEEDIINRLHFFDEDNLSPKIKLEKKQSKINQKFNNINLELNDSTFKKNSENINNNNDNIQNNDLNELSKRSIRPPTNLSLEKITSLNNLYDQLKKKKDSLNETNNSIINNNINNNNNDNNNSLLKESLNTFTQNLNKKWKDLTNDDIKNIKKDREKLYNEEVSNNTTNINNNTTNNNVILENNELEYDKFEDEKIFDKVNQFTKVALNELTQSKLSVFSKEKTIKKYN